MFHRIIVVGNIHLTGKKLVSVSLFNKVVAPLLINRLQHRCFPLNFTKFLRTTVLQKTSWRLLLEVSQKCSVEYLL